MDLSTTKTANGYTLEDKTRGAQAKQATLKAATDLYDANSAEVQKVKESWSAVGVN